MSEGARRGRPPDVTINERALAATRQLLVDVGFDATNIQAVAAQAGIHASAIYRRWPSRIELIEEATFPGFAPESVAATGDLRGDLRRFVRGYLATLDAPHARVAAAGLLAYRRGVDRRMSPTYMRVSTRPHFAEILAAAPDGAIDPSLNPDDAFDVLLGLVLLRTLALSPTARRRSAERIVDVVLRVLGPTA